MNIEDLLSDPVEDLLARICESVQISDAQHEQAKARYSRVGEWLAANDSALAAFQPKIFPQGSLRIGTTVKPWLRNAFDLDLVCELNADWQRVQDPVALLNIVEARLRANPAYAPLIQRKNRCIRLAYADLFHMDILPALPDPASGQHCLAVPDREARLWKPSNPRGYADWFEGRVAFFQKAAREGVEPLPEQEAARQKRALKLAVQLFKRWRDVHYHEVPKRAPISIVLTTLAGHLYRGDTSVKSSLSGILGGLLDSLPVGQRLRVLNPSNPKENLSEKWDTDPGAYDLFVGGVRQFAGQWARVMQARGLHNIAPLLGPLFGEDLTKGVIEKHAEAIQEARTAQRLGFQPRTTATLGAIAPKLIS